MRSRWLALPVVNVEDDVEITYDPEIRPLPCEDTCALGVGFIGWVIKVAHRTLYAQVTGTFRIVVEVLRRPF